MMLIDTLTYNNNINNIEPGDMGGDVTETRNSCFLWEPNNGMILDLKQRR